MYWLVVGTVCTGHRCGTVIRDGDLVIARETIRFRLSGGDDLRVSEAELAEDGANWDRLFSVLAEPVGPAASGRAAPVGRRGQATRSHPLELDCDFPHVGPHRLHFSGQSVRDHPEVRGLRAPTEGRPRFPDVNVQMSVEVVTQSDYDHRRRVEAAGRQQLREDRALTWDPRTVRTSRFTDAGRMERRHQFAVEAVERQEIMEREPIMRRIQALRRDTRARLGVFVFVFEGTDWREIDEAWIQGMRLDDFARYLFEMDVAIRATPALDLEPRTLNWGRHHAPFRWNAHRRPGGMIEFSEDCALVLQGSERTLENQRRLQAFERSRRRSSRWYSANAWLVIRGLDTGDQNHLLFIQAGDVPAFQQRQEWRTFADRVVGEIIVQLFFSIDMFIPLPPILGPMARVAITALRAASTRARSLAVRVMGGRLMRRLAGEWVPFAARAPLRTGAVEAVTGRARAAARPTGARAVTRPRSGRPVPADRLVRRPRRPGARPMRPPRPPSGVGTREHPELELFQRLASERTAGGQLTARARRMSRVLQVLESSPVAQPPLREIHRHLVEAGHGDDVIRGILDGFAYVAGGARGGVPTVRELRAVARFLRQGGDTRVLRAIFNTTRYRTRVLAEGNRSRVRRLLAEMTNFRTNDSLGLNIAFQQMGRGSRGAETILLIAENITTAPRQAPALRSIFGAVHDVMPRLHHVPGSGGMRSLLRNLARGLESTDGAVAQLLATNQLCRARQFANPRIHAIALEVPIGRRIMDIQVLRIDRARPIVVLNVETKVTRSLFGHPGHRGQVLLQWARDVVRETRANPSSRTPLVGCRWMVYGPEYSTAAARAAAMRQLQDMFSQVFWFRALRSTRLSRDMLPAQEAIRRLGDAEFRRARRDFQTHFPRIFELF